MNHNPYLKPYMNINQIICQNSKAKLKATRKKNATFGYTNFCMYYTHKNTNHQRT